MSYTDRKPSPRPTVTERAFSGMTDAEREAMSIRWLRENLLSPADRITSESDMLYPRTAEPKP